MDKAVLDKYYPILKKHYPNLSADKIKLYEDGHDHYVFVVNDKHAFRFPRSDGHGKQDHVINIFSQEFAPLSPVPIQKMVGQVDLETGIKYQMYEFIPGTYLSKELARKLTETELVSIATDVGNFLKHLHRFPPEKAREMNMNSLVSPQDYGLYFKDIIQIDKKLISSYLTQKEWEWIEEQTNKFFELTQKHPFSFTVTHSDMLPEHILIDTDSHRLSGIIDFSLRIADPANDFKYFDRYPDLFLKTVYENYLPVDEFFDERRKFYAGDLPVANLYQSAERKDTKMIGVHVSELKEYIASNPK